MSHHDQGSFGMPHSFDHETCDSTDQLPGVLSRHRRIPRRATVESASQRQRYSFSTRRPANCDWNLWSWQGQPNMTPQKNIKISGCLWDNSTWFNIRIATNPLWFRSTLGRWSTDTIPDRSVHSGDSMNATKKGELSGHNFLFNIDILAKEISISH